MISAAIFCSCNTFKPDIPPTFHLPQKPEVHNVRFENDGDRYYLTDSNAVVLINNIAEMKAYIEKLELYIKTLEEYYK